MHTLSRVIGISLTRLLSLVGLMAMPFMAVGQTTPSERVVLDPQPEAVSVAAVGDVMLGSWVTPILDTRGAFYPFEPTAAYFQSSDITVANLEAPFTETGEPFDKEYTFKVPPRHAAGLREAGITVVTLANNHIMDYGEEGLLNTLQSLEAEGIHYCGAGRNLREANRPAVVEANGKRLAFFGYSMTFPTEFYAKKDSAGTVYPGPELMIESLAAWRDSVDFIVASFHWGAEKRTAPKDYQVHFAHLAVDHGADLVLGHHPHVLQGLEIYKNRLIAYSLGNFAFGSYSPHAVDSIILKVYLRENGLLYAQCIPINVNNAVVEFKPEILQDPARREVLAHLQELSRALNDGDPIVHDSGLILGRWADDYDAWLAETTVAAYWGLITDLSSLAQATRPATNGSDSSPLRGTQ